MARVTLHTGDPFITEILTELETFEMFGNEYIDDYGIEVPDNLVERYKKNWKEFLEIQTEINIILKERK